tara:strand:+ start:1408 stop:2226 length:819 start_codon:yes stop_codon:yes gene_type:complete
MNNYSTDSAGWVSRSHRAIFPFELARAFTVEEAVNLLATKKDGRLIAGGLDVTREMRAGQSHRLLIDISAIDELKGIRREANFIRIGALTTHWEIETDPLIKEFLPDFQEAWKTIGNIRIRMRGTVGGNLLAKNAGYDGQLLLGVCGAFLDFANIHGCYRVGAENICTEETALSLLVSILVPIVKEQKIGFDRSLKPVVSVAASLKGNAAKIGFGCVSSQPTFWSGEGEVEAETIMSIVPNKEDAPIGTMDYRRRMIGVLSKRLISNLQGKL